MRRASGRVSDVGGSGDDVRPVAEHGVLGVRLEEIGRAESHRALARWLSAFGVDFTVLDPPELREECRREAERHAALAERYTRA